MALDARANGNMSFPRRRPTFQSINYDPNQPIAWPMQLQQQPMKPPATSGEKKQITRNRTSYSCKTCRKRKIKCDKVHPACGNCLKNQDSCEWSISSREGSTLQESPEAARNSKRRKTDNTDGDDSSEEPSPESNGTKENGPKTVEDRLDRLTQLVEALSRGNHEEAAVHLESEFGLRQEDESKRKPEAVSNGLDDDILRPVFTRDSRPISPGDPERSVSPNYHFDIPTAGSASAELEDPLEKLNLGYLSVQEGGRSRYVGSTWFAFISDELDQLNVLLKDQNRYLSPSHIGNQECRNREDRSPSPVSDAPSDGQNHNSFHKWGDRHHHARAQFREDCEACSIASSDKFMLFQAMDAHPSRFVRMGADMVTGVPAERNSHVLFRCWMSGVHCYVPLLHPPAVLEKYNQFWDWYKNGRLSGLPLPEPDYLCVLYTIWYAGSVSISLKGLKKWFPDTSRAALSACFHDHAARCLTLMNFPRNASVYSIAALLMLQVIPAKEEEPLTISLFVSLAIRVAQTMGLHREPSLFNITPWKAETRRRIFWQIFELDAYVAVTSGLPPMMNDDFFDTRPISELKDMLHGTEDGDKYEADIAIGGRAPDDPDNPSTRQWTSHVSIHYLIARARYDSAHALSRILKMHLGTKRITRDHILMMRKIMAKIDRDINVTIRRIPTKGIPELDFEPDKDEHGNWLVSDYDSGHANPPSEADIRPFLGMTPTEGLDDHNIRYHWNTLAAFHKFGRIVLSLLIDKMYCVSFLPLLKNAKSKFWACARQCALRSCHGYMRKFISLATNPAFQPFQWSWPGMHQPMHAAMIMLVDLYERPKSVEAPRSRAFIDKIFSMSGPDGGILSGEDGVTVRRPLREGGREAWELLRKLREKAWIKAGLDPNVLWTEESQIHAGVAQPLTEVQQMSQSLREDTLNVKPSEINFASDPKTSTSAGVQDFVSSAVNDLQSADGPAEHPAVAGVNITQDQFRPTTSFPPAQSLPPDPMTAAPGQKAGYFVAAPSVSASPFDPNFTRTTTTSQENSSTNPATVDSLHLDIHGVMPFNGNGVASNGATVPEVSKAHEEHHDADFWTKWDSILGSHAGFTFEDMMEDIRWDDLGSHEHDHET